MQNRTVGLGVAALVLFTAREASAIWSESRLVRGGLDLTERTFTIHEETREGLRQFEVTVTPKNGRPLSPFAGGTLQLIQGEKSIAQLPVAARWKQGAVSFWFKVSPEALEHSRFDFREQAYIPARGERGEPSPDPARRQRYEMMLGGHAWYFVLGDFAGTSAPPKS